MSLSQATVLVVIAAAVGSAIYCYRSLKKDKSLIWLAVLVCLALGSVLLIMDLVLIVITSGPQYILDALVFERNFSDQGFAGRWIFTGYVFLGLAFVILLYGIIQKIMKKL